MEGSKPFAFELVMHLAVLLIRECPMSRYEGCYTRYSSCSDCYQKGGMTRSDWLGDLLQVVTVKLSTVTPAPLKCNMVPYKVEAEALMLVCILVIATIILLHTILHRGLHQRWVPAQPKSINLSSSIIPYLPSLYRASMHRGRYRHPALNCIRPCLLFIVYSTP